MEFRKNALKFLALLSTLLLVSCDYRLFDLAQFPELRGNLPDLNLENKITEQNFMSVFQTIIEPKCMGCHKEGGKAEDIRFGTYQELMAATNEVGLSLIVAGKPDDSLFYTVMLASAKRRMPPKKSEIPPPGDDRLETVRMWILNGAQEGSPNSEPAPQPDDKT